MIGVFIEGGIFCEDWDVLGEYYVTIEVEFGGM